MIAGTNSSFSPKNLEFKVDLKYRPEIQIKYQQQIIKSQGITHFNNGIIKEAFHKGV